MTGEEYRRIRERLGLNQGELGQVVGVRLNTISRRELGQLPVTREAELAIRYVEQHQKNKKGRNQGR